MRRINIIGCPGSGKSTLARELHKITGIPLFHLDMLYWNPDKTIVDKAVFRSRLTEVMAQDEWIMDGNFSSTMEERIAASDTVIFLDYPTQLCLDGVRERRGKPRLDLPWIETEEDAEFTEYISSFHDLRRPQIIALLDKYSDKNIVILSDRTEAEKYLLSLKM